MEQIITNEDLQYLTSESSQHLNMILAGMTTLMEENNNKVSLLENQNWFQRMSKTILGKNKMTQQEIVQNHNKINLYITQAMGELYNRNCIDHELILGLGNKINNLYESQVEIKSMIGAFAQKLNQKIESIDNYHMLITEINQGIYNINNPFVSISKIMSQLDLRTIQDDRKMEILVRALEEQKILERKDILFSKMLEEVLSLNESDAGVLAIFFGNLRNEYVAEISEETIYTYYVLPEKTRKMKSKHSIVESILKQNDVDLDYSVSSYEMCHTLIEAYATNVVEAAIEEQKNEEQEKKDFIQEYVDDSLELLYLLRDMVPSWEANNGELNTPESRKEYSEFMTNVIDNLDVNSYIGISIITNLNNITFFAQNLFAKHNDWRISKALNKDFGEIYQVNKNIAMEIGENESKTVSEYFESFIYNMFNNSERTITKHSFRLENLNAMSADYPDPDNFTDFHLSYVFMDAYVSLFEAIFAKILEKIENSDFIHEIYSLCKKFPVTYDEDYDEILMREINTWDSHIELEYTQWGTKINCIGYANLICSLRGYETTVVLVKLVNINIKNYTVSYHIIENDFFDINSMDEYKYVDVEWGEWVDSNIIELKITKNNSEFGNLKMKIYIKEKPDIMAYIKG